MAEQSIELRYSDKIGPARGLSQGGKITLLSLVLDIFDNLDLMRRIMILTDAATALRVSEELALQWWDLNFTEQLIHVRRAYVAGRFGKPKSKASRAPVPMHPLLAAHLLAWRKQTPYPRDEDLVFPSLRLKGRNHHQLVVSYPTISVWLRKSQACTLRPALSASTHFAGRSRPFW